MKSKSSSFSDICAVKNNTTKNQLLRKGGKLNMLPFLLGRQTVYKAQREVEPIEVPTEEGQLESQSIRLRSKVSMCKARISFVNCTDLIVGALWVNHLGQEVSYGLIMPRKETIYSTYTYHPWVIRSMGDGSRMCLVTRQRDQQRQSIQRAQQVVMCTRARSLLQVFIYRPPTIPWNIDLHPLFFENGEELIATLTEVLESKGIYDQNFVQFLVDNTLGNIAPTCNYDIALHGNIVDVDSISGVQSTQLVRPFMVNEQLQSLILKQPQVLQRRFIQ